MAYKWGAHPNHWRFKSWEPILQVGINRHLSKRNAGRSIGSMKPFSGGWIPIADDNFWDDFALRIQVQVCPKKGMGTRSIPILIRIGLEPNKILF